jgi:hypothetical protein
MRLATTTGNLLIGGTTDITGSGGLKVFGTTASTSTTTGALQVAGGVGVAGALFTGGSGNFSASTTASSGSINVVSADPAIRLTDTDGVADRKTFEIRALGTSSSDFLQIRTINDANAVFTTRLALWNTGGLYLGTDPVGAGNPGSGNLTVSGGTVGTAASTNLTLAGGSSGASLVLGQGANGVATFNSPIRSTGAQSAFTSGLGEGVLRLESSTAPTSTGQRLYALGFGTTADLGKARIEAYALDAWTSGSVTPTYLSFNTTPAASASQSEAFRVTRNVLVGGTTDITGSGGLKVFGTTASTSTTTGALQVAGGVGVAGAGYFSGERINNTFSANDATRIQARNDTSGTAAQAQVSATLGNFTTYTAMGSLSAGFTTSGLFAANSGYIASNATAGLNLFTTGATALTLGTNGTARLTIASGGDSTFSGAIAIGNTVNTVSPTSPDRTITIVVGGTTYYLAAKTTND